MMPNLFILEPEVAGGWGPLTRVTNKSRVESGEDLIPEVSDLEYRFDMWLGDEILTFISTFIITEELALSISEKRLTGLELGPVIISTSDEWEHFGGKVILPPFKRLIPTGQVRITEDNRAFEWSGHDFCWGLRNVSIDSDTELVRYSIPPYSLVVSAQCLDVLKEHQLNYCDINPLS